jgi:hypothetical protein
MFLLVNRGVPAFSSGSLLEQRKSKLSQAVTEFTPKTLPQLVGELAAANLPQAVPLEIGNYPINPAHPRRSGHAPAGSLNQKTCGLRLTSGTTCDEMVEHNFLV